MKAIGMLAIVFCLGCAGEAVAPEQVERARGDAVVGGQVVSTVDGHPITLADVRHAVEITGVEPELALRRLQDELLLTEAARRAGYADDEEARQVARRVAVQRLLAEEVEAAHGPEEVDPAELEAAFEENLARFETPERRASVTVSARPPENAPPGAAQAARAFAAEVWRELAAADDPSLAAFAVQRRVLPNLPFEVSVDEVDPLSRRDEESHAYLDALFAAEAPGLLPELVQTEVGFHAVVLTEIVPASELTREEALDVLRDERVARARAEALGELVAEIGGRTQVQVDVGTTRAALASPNLLGDPR